MDRIHHLWTWFLCGVFLIAAAGYVYVLKARKGPMTPSCSDAAQLDQDGGRLQHSAVVSSEPDLVALLQELFARTGFTPEETRERLVSMGVLAGDPKEASSFAPVVTRQTGHAGVGREIGKAIQVGLKWARSEDDYAHAGVEYSAGDPDQTFEAILVNPEARDRQELCARLLTNLQEMLRRGEFPQARKQIEDLIAALNDQAARAEEELTWQGTVRESEIGTRADRQYYAFQTGVIQHLRRKRLFQELNTLYRPGTTESALNYNDQDAFALLKLRCGIFAAIEQMGIQKLLQTDEGDIRAMIERALPGPSEPGSTS